MGRKPRKKAAVVLLSGGVDSSTVAAIAQSEGYELYCISVDYGQRHRVELRAARRVAKSLGAKEHRIVRMDLRAIGGSALTSAIRVPKGRSLAAMSREIPVTYVPARNTVFLALALGYAERVGVFDIFIGANAVDYSGYPDCRPAFLRAFERLSNLATKAGVEGRGRFRIRAPLLRWRKSKIVRKGLDLGLDFSLTHSCYDPDFRGAPCRRCDSCRIRSRAFEEAGIAPL